MTMYASLGKAVIVQTATGSREAAHTLALSVMKKGQVASAQKAQCPTMKLVFQAARRELSFVWMGNAKKIARNAKQAKGSVQISHAGKIALH